MNVAYISNEFPSPVEPYVMDEINELRRRNVNVICCSGKRVAPHALSPMERAFWKETRYFQPLSDDQLTRAARRLVSNRNELWRLSRHLLAEKESSLNRRFRTVGHTLMGSVLAEELAPLEVEHIHCHHGYFASWMALVAARLLGIDFSITLHGSDLLQRADLLEAKLRECKFCVTVSEFNREYLLRNYPSIAREKVLVQRLGVDALSSGTVGTVKAAEGHRPFCLLAVGRLHPVKNYSLLIEACSELRAQGVDTFCWIVGEGAERAALERQIVKLRLQGYVQLVGHISRSEVGNYYGHADLVVMTSKSEGIPVVLMEAMSRGKLVLAPAITGIPELVEHQATGFLYEPGSRESFVNSVRWIQANQERLAGVRRAAAAKVADSYHRQRNVRAFADGFLARVPKPGGDYANSVLQQIRLSV
ncbi:MAG: glycosyltransferase family 4 protein [Terriglobales bacterium]